MRHQPTFPRKVIAVDLDEVLARTSVAIAEFHNDTYGTSLTVNDFTSYDFTKVWGGTREESIGKWRLFFDSPYFHKVEPVEGSLETLKLLKSRRFSLVIVTARQQFVADLTKKFVDRHFPGIFESIYFANHFLTEEEKLTFVSKPKSVICRDVQAELLIDDSLENAAEVANAGIPVLLFDLQGTYMWNKLPDGQPLPDKVTRVKSWKEIQAWFPRPRSPLSYLCLSRDDQVSEDDSDDSDMNEDTGGNEQQQQKQHRRRALDSDSDSDEDLDKEEEENMNETAKREQEEEEHHGRTLRRRKFMMMDFSGPEEDDDINLEQGENMDSDEQDLDLESGGHARRRHISHEDIERCRHQHEALYTGNEDNIGMEMEMEMDMESSIAKSTTTITQLDGDMVQSSMIVVATSTTTATNVASAMATLTSHVSIAAVQVEPHSLETIPTEAVAVGGLAIRSPASESLMATLLHADKCNMDMKEVPLA